MGSLALRLACLPLKASLHRLLDTALDWLTAERVICSMNTSQFTRSAKLGLAHQRREEK